jgi:hypothetical protein
MSDRSVIYRAKSTARNGCATREQSLGGPARDEEKFEGEGTTRCVVGVEKKRKASWKGVRKETELPTRTGETRA